MMRYIGKKMVSILLCITFVVYASQEALKVDIDTVVDNAQKTNILIILATVTEKFKQLADLIAQDLRHSGQCCIVMRQGKLPTTKKEVEEFYKEGYPFVVFLSYEKNSIEGRLYDALDIAMMKGKRWQHNETDGWGVVAHTIAQDIWMELMGCKGSFLTKIAYVKKDKRRYSTQSTSLCLVDWDGKNPQVILSSKKIMVAPCWNKQAVNPVLFFSEFTNKNVRLMATNLQGNRWPVIDTEGTLVGICNGKTNHEVVYGKSGDIWTCSYDVQTKKCCHTLLIRESGMCACPTRLPNGNILYCSRGKLKMRDAITGKSTVLPCSGHCTAPAYHEPSQKVVFSKKINGIMQLCIYDIKKQIERQMTDTIGDKIDPTWSPCGSYIAFCYTQGIRSEICVYNVITGEQYRVSPENESCAYPAWSPGSLF